MATHRDIRALQRQILLGQIVMVAVMAFGVFAIWLYFAPPFQPDLYQGKLILLIVGSLFLLMGLVGIPASIRTVRSVMRTFNHSSPVNCIISLQINRWSDSSDYKITIFNPLTRQVEWTVMVDHPMWNVQRLEEGETPARLYLDPKLHQPRILESQSRLLFITSSVREHVLK